MNAAFPMGMTTMTSDKSWVDASLEAAQGGYTLDQLSDAFDSVADPVNWKCAVDAIVPATANLDLIGRAVTWFAGCIAEFETLPDGQVRVTADGYYLSVGS